MLQLFTPWQMRQQSASSKLTWKLNGFNPAPGIVASQFNILGYNLDTSRKPKKDYDPDRLYLVFGGQAVYVQEVNWKTQEALIHCPFLPGAPWIKDAWYLVDVLDLEPQRTRGFNEARFRADYPEKPCPFEVIWGKYAECYNRRFYENQEPNTDEH